MPAAASGGGYSHFHWLNEPDHANGLMVGDPDEGVLLRLTANETFFVDHHGGFLIEPGIDAASHANIVPMCPDSEGGNPGEH